MDVLLISTFPPRRCGIGDYTADFAGELAKQHDVEVGVLTYKDGLKGGTSSQNGFEVLRELEGRTTPQRMASLLKRCEPELVHLESSSFLHHPSVNTSVAEACVSPLITGVHDAPRSWRIFYTIPGLRTIYKKSSRLITHSDRVSETLSEFHGVEEARIVKIPLGVDTNRYGPKVDNHEVRRRYGLEDTRIVLFFGFLRPGKGLRTLMSAWHQIENQHMDALLVVAGGVPSSARRYSLLLRSEKAYPRRLLRMVRQLNIQNRVVFTDHVPDELVPELLTAADLVVLPYSGSPSQSSALQKALSCGKAVIAARVPGVAELLRDGEDALLVHPGRAADLARAIEALLDSPSRAQSMGKRAREKALRTYDWSLIAERTRRVYEASLT